MVGPVRILMGRPAENHNRGRRAPSPHSFTSHWSERVDDILAVEQKRVALESDVSAVRILGVDRRLHLPAVIARLVHENGTGDPRGVALLRLGDFPILN